MNIKQQQIINALRNAHDQLCVAHLYTDDSALTARLQILIDELRKIALELAL